MQDRLAMPPAFDGLTSGSGSEAPPLIAFRDVDYFDLWVRVLG